MTTQIGRIGIGASPSRGVRLSTCCALSRSLVVAAVVSLANVHAAHAQTIRAPASPRVWESDSSQEHATLRQAIAEFHVQWNTEWRQSEEARALMTGPSPIHERRLPYIHCHAELKSGDVFRGRRNGTPVARPDSQYQRIRSAASNFAVCPSWLFAVTVANAREETRYLDGALLDARRARSERARARLLYTLDSAGGVAPSDQWITGQRVRFHLDQRDLTHARDAAQACIGTRWWCAASQGLVACRANRFAEADSLFSAMRQAMPDGERGVWEDWPSLMRLTERREVADGESCKGSSEASVRFWWLAHPLWRDSWNERRHEQEARRILIKLHQGLVQDERFVWDARRGGDAIAELMYRYGWPTYTAWGGKDLDHSHGQYLAISGDPPAAPYTTFEYAIGRVHTTPSVALLRHPYESDASAWRLTSQDSLGVHIIEWWPHEHFLPLRPMADLPVGQSVHFRRQTQVLAAAAVVLQASSLRPATSASVRAADSFVDVLLLSSREPGSVDSLGQVTATAGTVARFQKLIASIPQVLSLEARRQQASCGDARWRFGVRPPPTLSTMRPGEVAISAPAILSVPATATSATTRTFEEPREELLDLLHPTTTLAAGERRIGVYWETYGLAASDTVTVAIRVAADTTLSRLRRVGVALSVASDPRSEVIVQWNEPNAAYSTRTLVGPVPVQLRSILLDLSPLRSGTYTLEVSAHVRGGVVVRASQRLTLR